MTPGDEFTAAWVKRAEELERIPEDERTSDNQRELDALKEAARFIDRSRELADDKSTPFVDESRRPQLDGTDWNDFNNAMCRDEVKALGIRYGLPLVKLAVESLLLKG